MASNRVEKYITFQELPSLAKTRRWYVLGKDKKPFAIIKWYGGWRKYVCIVEQDTFFDSDGMRLISDFLREKNRMRPFENAQCIDPEGHIQRGENRCNGSCQLYLKTDGEE